jgi:tRNA(Ile)-lysidine synthetase-like protein
VAVSGGADSTALLVALASLARESGVFLHAAHLHHGLRGRAADADLHHVRALCARLGVPLTAARLDCAARMRRRGLRGEAGLRLLRREWLAAAARRAGALAIATAHTADDQLETLLMRLARGTGLAGAAGMRARQGAWLKPLLSVTRAALEHDLRRHGIRWREDASNASPAYLRNRVRHVAVPALLDALGVAAGEPAARRAPLARRAAALASELADAHRVLARGAVRALARATAATAKPAAPSGGRPAVTFEARALARLPVALQRLALRRAWREAGDAESPGLTSRQLEPLLHALARERVRAGAAADVALPGGWRGSIRAGRLGFSQAPGAVPGAPRGARGARTGVSRRARRADARLHGNHGRAGSGRAARSTPRRPRSRKTPQARPADRPAASQERS